LPLYAERKPYSKEFEEGYWHAMVIGRYPSLEVAMTYQISDVYINTAGYHRTASFEDNQLFVLIPVEMAD
jgi:hypothetical protein